MKGDSTEQAMSILMDALARVLVRLDITPSRLGEVVRTSFVRAAASAERKKTSGRPHIARIAAITGLTRAEVKRIVDSGFVHRTDQTEHLPRALRVLAAWKASRKYTKDGKPRALQFSGASPSFESLCKEFSGDIPHKAIFAELISKKLVKMRSIGEVAVATVARESSKSRADTLQLLSNAAWLIDSLTKQDQLLLWRHVQAVTPPDMSDSYFVNSVTERMRAVVDGLPAKPKGKRQKTRTDGLNVFAIVSRRDR
jgi:hypothetical protein